MRSQQILHMVLASVKAGDPSVLADVLSGESLAVARELGQMLENFDYIDSIAFQDLMAGKSAAVIAAHRRRCSEPSKRNSLREELYDHVRRLWQDGQIERYFPERDSARIARIVIRLKAIDAANSR